MIRLRCVLLCLSVLCAPAWAQDAEPVDLQAQMTAEEFKAAGLDRLTPQELAALNAWLQRRVGESTEAAVAQAVEEARESGRREVVQAHRGFFSFGSDEPIESRIAGEFNGFGKGRRYVLENGQTWQQTDATVLAGVRRQQPKVTIKPRVIGNTWFMQIEGYNTRAEVRRVE